MTSSPIALRKHQKPITIDWSACKEPVIIVHDSKVWAILSQKMVILAHFGHFGQKNPKKVEFSKLFGKKRILPPPFAHVFFRFFKIPGPPPGKFENLAIFSLFDQFYGENTLSPARSMGKVIKLAILGYNIPLCTLFSAESMKKRTNLTKNPPKIDPKNVCGGWFINDQIRFWS